jgi:hypothetical protein
VSPNDIQIQPYNEGDIDALSRFIDTHWRRGYILARDQSFLRWQFAPIRPKADAADSLTILLAWRDGRIVGMLGRIEFDFNVRGTLVAGVWLSHWLSIPEVRADGVGLRLLRAIGAPGVDAIFILGLSEVAWKIYASLGFELLPSLPRWIGVFDLKRCARLLEAAHPAAEVKDLDQLCAGYMVDVESDTSGDRDVEVVKWSESLAAAWDSTWTEQLAPSLISPARDSSYLRRRYIDHSTFTYEIRLARDPRTGTALGLTVFRVETIRGRSEKVLRVSEFLAAAKAERSLALSVVQAAQSNDTIFADFYCTSERAARGLELIGFRRHRPATGPGFPRRFQPMEGGPEINGAFWLSASLRRKLHPNKLLTSTDFYITRSDGDQDRPN